MSELLMKTANALIAHCRNNTTDEGLETLYAPDCVSVEAMGMNGSDPETKGIEGIKGKHAWWDGAFEVHSLDVGDPMIHGSDRFACTFEMDCTDKESGERTQMKEIAIYTVNDAGKISREEFFYPFG